MGEDAGAEGSASCGWRARLWKVQARVTAVVSREAMSMSRYIAPEVAKVVDRDGGRFHKVDCRFMFLGLRPCQIPSKLDEDEGCDDPSDGDDLGRE